MTTWSPSYGRFVPALDVTLTVLDGDRELFTTTMPFLWHPYLYHYGTNARARARAPTRSGSGSTRRPSCATTR